MIHFEQNIRNFGQAMAVSAVPLLVALLQHHLVVLAISSFIQDYRTETPTVRAIHNSFIICANSYEFFSTKNYNSFIICANSYEFFYHKLQLSYEFRV